jgi:hypothetical protein
MGILRAVRPWWPVSPRAEPWRTLDSIQGGAFVRYRIKASPKYQLLVSLVAANVVTIVAVDYFAKIIHQIINPETYSGGQ